MSRLYAIDGLRGLAALALLVYHSRSSFWVGINATYREHGLAPNLNAWIGYLTAPFSFGGLGVTLFFVLSGFCIHRRGARNLASSNPPHDSKTIALYIGGFCKTGGIETFVKDLLVAIDAPTILRRLIIWGRPARQNALLQEVVMSGVKVHRSPWIWGCRWNLPDYLLFLCSFRIVKRADIVVFKKPPPTRILGWLRRINAKASFVLVTPYKPSEYWREKTGAPTGDQFDLIITQSLEGRKDLIELGYRGDIEVVPYIPPAAFSATPAPHNFDKHNFKLGFLGRIEPQKNLSYLLDCYAKLCELDLGYTMELHVFGDGSEMDILKRLSEDLGLKHVYFHGLVEQHLTPNAIDSCDLFLITSKTEGQCLVALETLSRGRPIVATPVGALPEVLANPIFGRIGPPDDVNTFAEVVRLLIDEVRLSRDNHTLIQKTFTSQFGRDSISEKYSLIFARLLARER